MKTLRTLTLSLGLIFMAGMLYAQEPMKAEKYDNPQWYYIVSVDYAPGKYDQAKKFIEDYFIKASEKAGTSGPVMALEMNSGTYDAMYIWHMKDGLDEMNWKTTADDVEWFKAMAELAGGQEKAQEIWQEYQSLVSSSKAELARKL
ncbi:hypothetical protein [Robertkochia aurantiaca]|uniref:hypothetical protein n=1 Tax=Robertkochia aurantiaca TaxID=2873700 RepID=UPI001CC9CF22|nr:hypothetical protein [Robertkochia sp. 3YJGBD-33]